MASTYSASLKAQLMTTGENSGTWGAVTNTNLSVVMEEAIAGSATITFASGAYTLTFTDTNATQEYRNMRLLLGGTSGGAQNLIVPDAEKVYIIDNGTADTITVKTAAGTGKAVPTGRVMWVYCDATNVVDVTSHLTSLTLGSALPVLSGGTGSTTGTFSGANITALNATNVDAGTLAVARGGTGAVTHTDGGVLLGAGTSAITALAVTTDGSIIIGDGTTAPTTLAAFSSATGTLKVANGGTGAATHTSAAVLVGAGTSAVTSVSPGTTGNVLTSTGSAWASEVGSAFATGTRMLFQQATAPTGWTIDITVNNYMLRLVDGSTQTFETVASPGGSDAFTTAFSASKATESYTLLIADIPAHTHSYSDQAAFSGSGGPGSDNNIFPLQSIQSKTTGSTGGGGGHAHDITLDPSFVDVIIASKA